MVSSAEEDDSTAIPWGVKHRALCRALFEKPKGHADYIDGTKLQSHKYLDKIHQKYKLFRGIDSNKKFNQNFRRVYQVWLADQRATGARNGDGTAPRRDGLGDDDVDMGDAAAEAAASNAAHGNDASSDNDSGESAISFSPLLLFSH